MTTLEQQVEKLTNDLSKKCSGQGAAVVVGAGLNIVMTAAQLIPDKVIGCDDSISSLDALQMKYEMMKTAYETELVPLRKASKPQLTDEELIDAVGDMVGMSCGAWDVVNPSELAQAFRSLLQSAHPVNAQHKAQVKQDPVTGEWLPGDAFDTPSKLQLSDEEIDGHLDAILKASGSGLRNYSMFKTLSDMRESMRNAIDAAIAQSKEGGRVMIDADHVVAFLQSMGEIEMAASVTNMHNRLEAFSYGLDRDCHQVLAAHIETQERINADKQATIDRLMLEYCPNEMTTAQIEEWGKQQRPAQSKEPA